MATPFPSTADRRKLERIVERCEGEKREHCSRNGRRSALNQTNSAAGIDADISSRTDRRAARCTQEFFMENV